MDRYLQMGVKDVIEAFPGVGKALERHGVGCVPCTVGTCKLEDVVQIHALPPEEEERLMAEIREAIYPGRGPAAPAAPAAAEPSAPREISYSPPVQRLVDEHALIKRLLSLIPDLIQEVRASGEIHADTADLLGRALEFIRGYADRFHHMKEEDILFDYTDREADIIRVIGEDHDRARGHVRAAASAIDGGDNLALIANLAAYRELLSEHIKKEDEVLYPYIDRALTTAQVGQIFQRFEETESELPPDVPGKYEQFIADLARRFNHEKEDERCHTLTKDVQAPA
jgi:hemerythrin-like domain-containing protein